MSAGEPTPPSPSPSAKPAWTSWWVWGGAAIFFGGLLIASRAIGGYGHPAVCGKLGLNCFGFAASWLAATEGFAAVLLWIGSRRQARKSRARGFCLLGAVLALLMFLAAGFVVFLFGLGFGLQMF